LIAKTILHIFTVKELILKERQPNKSNYISKIAVVQDWDDFFINDYFICI